MPTYLPTYPPTYLRQGFNPAKDDVIVELVQRLGDGGQVVATATKASSTRKIQQEGGGATTGAIKVCR